MTPKTAQNRLDNLKSANEISVDNAVEGFQLSLALGDRAHAIYFKKLYQAKLYELFYDVAINISNPDFLEKFFHFIEDWRELYCCNHKAVYVAMLLKQKDQIQDFQKLYEALKNVCYTLDQIETSQLLSKSLDELKAIYLQELAEYKTYKVYENLSNYAIASHDIAVARKVLPEIPSNLIRMRDEILEQMVKLLIVSEKEEALSLVSDIQTKYVLQNVYYHIAKTIYPDDPDQANVLISELPIQYCYGFNGYKAAAEMNEEEISSTLYLIDLMLKNDQISQYDYDSALIEIAFAIVEHYPSIAFGLIDKLQDNSVELLEVQQKVAEIFLMRDDLDKGTEYFHKIEQEFHQFLALLKVIRQSDDPQILQTLRSLSDRLLEPAHRFYVYEELSQKIAIPFETMYALSEGIKPYRRDDRELHELHEIYEEYFAF